ncbi:MAG: FHA domain-containing protein [Deltaproteobacteria bacterium]|nr:MAG: FHA domain-containing protein [Deltaproteobacteria bacterium]
MAKLILKLNDKVLSEFPITKRKITIGRKAENDLVIQNMAVSGRHARLDYKKGKFIITDLKSLNGTFVNNKLITQAELKIGDEITIGRHTLVLSADDASPALTGETVLPKDGLILNGDSPTRRILSKKKPKDDTYQGEATKPISKLGVISFISNDQPDVTLDRKITKIGKGKEADVKVSGLLVGKVAAIISRRPTGYYITPVGGMGKLKVNGEPVKDVYRLQEFDMIQVGSTKIQFYYQDN